MSAEPTTIRGRVVIADASRPVLRDTVVELDGGEVRRLRPAGDGDRGPIHDVLMPGLIDAHSHARAVSVDDHGIHGGPLERFLVLLAAMTPLDPGDEAHVAADAALSAGITCTQVIHHSFAAPPANAAHARAIAEGYATAGVRAAISLAVSDQDEWAPLSLLGAWTGGQPATVPEPSRQLDLPGYLALVEELLGEGPSATVRFDAVGPVAPQWCRAATRAAIGAARGSARVHAHLLESPDQRRVAAHRDPVADLERAGLLGPFSSFAHGVWLEAADRARLADAGATVVHNPGSNRRLGVGECHVRALLDAGVAVALGIDSNGTAAEPDLFAEMRLAREIAAGLGAPLGAAEVLAMATTGGARALCRPDLGRLGPGAAADLIALELPGAVAAADPVAHVVDHAAAEHVAVRWVAGRRRDPTGAGAARARLAAALEADRDARRARLAAADRDWRKVQGAWATVRAHPPTTI